MEATDSGISPFGALGRGDESGDRKPGFRNIRAKLALALFAALSVGACVVAGSFFRTAIIRTHEHIAIESANIASVLDGRLGATFSHVTSALDDVSDMVPAESFLPAAQAENRARVGALLAGRHTGWPDVAALALVDASGAVLYASGGSSASPIDPVAFAELHDNPAAGLAFSDVHVDPATGRRTMIVARGVRDAQGHFVGAIAATLDLAALTEAFQGLDLGRAGFVEVRRTDNFKLVTSWPDHSGDINTAPPSANRTRPIIAAGSKAGTVDIVSVIDHQPRIVSLRTIDGVPLYIMVAISPAEALATLRRHAIEVGGLGAVLFVVFGALAWRLYRALLNEARASREFAHQGRWLQVMANGFELSAAAILVIDASERVVAANPAFLRVNGFTLGEVVGQPAASVDAYLASRDQMQAREDALARTGHWEGEVAGRRRNGTLYPRWVSVSRVGAGAGGPGLTVASSLDITDLKATEQRLRFAEGSSRLYGRIFEGTNAMVVVHDDDRRIVVANPAFCEGNGYGEEEIMGGSARVIASPRNSQERLAAIDEALLTQGRWRGELWGRRKDGTDYPRWASLVRIPMDEGEGFYTISSSVDITELKRVEFELRETERRLRLMGTVFEHSGEAIMVTDALRRIVAVNPAFTQITGYTIDDVQGLHPNILWQGEASDAEREAQMLDTVATGIWQGETLARRKDGSLFPGWLIVAAIRDENGGITHLVSSFTDISDRKAAEHRIQHLAYHDTLTGLPNRLSLHGRLGQALTGARRSGKQVAVMFIDMDRFKSINDTLGHEVGDHLLVEVARRLSAAVRESDIVARLGGDEFVVVLTDLSSAEIVARQAERIVRDLGQPYMIAGHNLHSTPSLGISLFPADGDSIEALTKAADTAMYHVKSEGRNGYQFFAARMNETVAERMALENGLREGLGRGEFSMHYQPQIDAISGGLVGFEALMRWKHAERGMVPPSKFIPVAEEAGVINDLGMFALRESLRQLKEWRDAGHAGGRVAVNLSAHQLRSSELPNIVAEAIAEHGLHPSDLEFEITESVAMKNPEATIAILGKLREIGVELAIDDFGTGYSSLAYLKLLPIQRLKLDQSFVRDIEIDPNDRAICAATIALAHSLGLEVVAEGVETQAQYDFMRGLRCDVVQGYFFGKPLPPDLASAYLRNRAQEMA